MQITVTVTNQDGTQEITTLSTDDGWDLDTLIREFDVFQDAK